MKKKIQYKLTTGLVLLFLLGTAQADIPSAEKQIRRVVNQVSEAVTKKDLNGVLSTFSDDAIRFNLYSANAKQASKAGFSNKKVSSLADMWSGIAKILFPQTEIYERKVTKMDVHADRSMATVWATINTRSKMKAAGSEINTRNFSEVYLLKLIKGEWKIVAMTNNRKDDFSTKEVSKY